MALHRRFILLCALASLGFGSLSFLPAQQPANQQPGNQQPANGPVLSGPDKSKDQALTRTGARRTAVVAAIERVKGAVVNIHTERVDRGVRADAYGIPGSPKVVNGMGTGIIVDPRGYIVTNHHVIEEVSLMRVRLADGTTQLATVVARQPDVDLALLKIDSNQPLPVMPIGTAADLMVGETVIAIGNAYGYEHTVSVGVVSAVKRDVSLNKDMAYKSLIQTDAAINPGNSGGPLVNINGELVGVNVAIRAGAQGIGFAIPSDQMVRSVADMLKSRRQGQPQDGLIVRDRLENTDDGLVRSVVVDRTDGPAAVAGLKSGDVVVQVGDTKVSSSIDVERALLDRKSGDNLPVYVRRKGKEHRLDLVLNNSERMNRPANADLAWIKLGIQLAPLPGETVNRLNRLFQGGLEVVNISDEGAAAKAGIKKGDILVGLHHWQTVNLDNISYVLNHPDLASFSPLWYHVIRSGQALKGTIGPLQ